MAEQTGWMFDGSTSQWMQLGAAERRLRDETMLSVVMAYHTWNHTVSLSVYEPRGELLVSKSFSRWSIDSASYWLAKLTADYSSWK